MMKISLAQSIGRLALSAALAVALAAPAAGAATGPTLTTSLSPSAAPALGKLVSGSSGVTTYVVTPAGAVSYSGGGVRVLGTASVTTSQLTITWNGTGAGAASCSNFKKVVVSLGGQSSSGGRTGTVTGITGSLASGSATVSAVNATSFQVTPSGGSFSNGQVVVVNIGTTIQFNNTGSGLGSATSVSYSLTSTGS